MRRLGSALAALKPPPRFIDNGDGTVTDTATGRMWAKRNQPHDTHAHWDEAWRYCQNSRLGGHSDWRLPTVNELRSLSLGNPVKGFFNYEWVSGHGVGGHIKTMEDLNERAMHKLMPTRYRDCVFQFDSYVFLSSEKQLVAWQTGALIEDDGRHNWLGILAVRLDQRFGPPYLEDRRIPAAARRCASWPWWRLRPRP